MYWRLLTSNPGAARDIVMSEKPVISTETDRMDKGMLDQVNLPSIPQTKTDWLSCSYTPVPLAVFTTRIPTYVIALS
jgi:hypothetical protein